MKKYVLKKWVKKVIFIIYIIGNIAIFYLIFRITPEQQDALEYCVKQGYSKIECERNLFGY